MKPLNFILMSLPLLLLAGCAGVTSQSVADQKAELCTNLARFNTAVVTLKSMGANSTVGDFRQAQEQVKLTFNEVKTSAQNVREAKVAELEQAYGELDNAVQTIPDTATLQQATASVSEQVAAVEAAQSQMQSGLNCQQ
ncbi:MAG: hypothetical protein Kow00121_10050 [Elainellaceae cyanobacterium]